MTTDSPRRRYLKSLVASQPRLFAYVVSLLHDPEWAYDVLQQANVVMLDKANEFVEQGTPFPPWAFKVCYYEVLSERRDRARGRHVFDDNFLETIADQAAEHGEGFEQRHRALTTCLEQLSKKPRRIVTLRYAPGGSVKSLASLLGRSAESISRSLYRIRKALRPYIQVRLTREGGP